MGKFFFNHALTSTPTSLFVNMCAAPLVGMVQSGTDQEVLDKATAAHSAHCSKLGTAGAAKLHKVKNAGGQSVHAVKMGTAGAAALHKEKNAAGQSVHAVKRASKRKYPAQADESNANFECLNCFNLFFYATPLERNGQKRKHQRCEGKSRVLVPYHAMH